MQKLVLNDTDYMLGVVVLLQNTFEVNLCLSDGAA